MTNIWHKLRSFYKKQIQPVYDKRRDNDIKKVCQCELEEVQYWCSVVLCRMEQMLFPSPETLLPRKLWPWSLIFEQKGHVCEPSWTFCIRLCWEVIPSLMHSHSCSCTEYCNLKRCLRPYNVNLAVLCWEKKKSKLKTKIYFFEKLHFSTIKENKQIINVCTSEICSCDANDNKRPGKKYWLQILFILGQWWGGWYYFYFKLSQVLTSTPPTPHPQ